jgi:poly-gamma-glutamate synthesis protein (capsule biosynthesis protein)
MRICFAGDIIMLDEPSEEFWRDNDLLNIIRDCDVSSGNLEMVLSGNRAFASTFCGGQWLSTVPERINSIVKMGFQHLNMANNHTMDYSYEGLKITNEVLDKRGVLHSGSGVSLEEALEPAIIRLDGERAAFIGVTASCDDASRAGSSANGVPARPGVNMLRHEEYLYVTDDELKFIDSLSEKLCLNARFYKAVSMGIHTLPKNIHRMGRLQFLKGEKTEKVTVCNTNDLKRISSKIEKIKKQGIDDIFIHIHSHDIKGMTDNTPDDYMREFAHRCIDSGASAIIGTGTHQLKAIEVYKGKPIFYSLGNFVFKCEKMPFAPADYYSRFNVEETINLEDFFKLRTKNYTTGLEFDKLNYLSIVPVLNKKEGKKYIEIIPVYLHYNDEYNLKGFPCIADGAITKMIFETLKELSKPYNTLMNYNEQKGLIELII